MEFHIGSHIQPPVRKKRNPIKVPTKLTPPESKLVPQCADMDPIYFDRKLRLSKAQAFDLHRKSIQIVCPNPHPENNLYKIVHTTMSLFGKSLFEWQLDCLERHTMITTILYGPDYIACMKDIFRRNQTLRWALKRLTNVWLVKRCAKKCIGKQDIVTMDQIPEQDQIRVHCLKSRCIYIFSGNSLLRSICSNMETQIQSIPHVTLPKNPYTNLVFTYGQTVHIYQECLHWCAKRQQTFPSIFALHREYNFDLRRLCKLHNSYLQYKAFANFLKNDDIDSNFFLENITEIIKTYKNVLSIHHVHAKLTRVYLFVKWIEKDPNHALLKQWYRFVTDYAFYMQTNIFPRDNWNSVVNVLQDFKALYMASLPYLQTYVI